MILKIVHAYFDDIISDIAILNIKSAHYRCIFSGISKSEAINVMENIDLSEKKEHYKA